VSTIAVVLIVIGAVIVIALLAAALKGARERKLEDRRAIAGEHREEAKLRQLEADKEAASADEQAARARREAAEAESRSRAAERERERARGHVEHAVEIDPDSGSERNDQGESARERPGRQ
jgi:FtsZ-interacting cell division protein ZipA